MERVTKSPGETSKPRPFAGVATALELHQRKSLLMWQANGDGILAKMFM